MKLGLEEWAGQYHRAPNGRRASGGPLAEGTGGKKGRNLAKQAEETWTSDAFGFVKWAEKQNGAPRGPVVQQPVTSLGKKLLLCSCPEALFHDT